MATWKPKTVKSVVQDIDDGIYVLPVIQRWLVWKEDKMELLFDSLLKGNSFGGIMILEEEKNYPPLFAFREFSRSGEENQSQTVKKLNSSKFLVIDGQQRLQTFYMGLRGGINGKTLFFNLNSTPVNYEFRFAQNSSTLPLHEINDEERQIEKIWYQVQNLYSELRKTGDPYLVTRRIIEEEEIRHEAVKEQVRNNILKFYMSIFASDVVGMSTVVINRDSAMIEKEKQRIVELFRRLNDGGTRLSSLDLLAAMFKGFDYRMEQFFRDVKQFDDIGISQDEVIKLIFLLQDNHARELTQIRKEDTEFALQNQTRIIKALEGVRQFLEKSKLYNYYRAGGRSDIPLYFIAYHLFFQDTTTEQLSDYYSNYDINNVDYLRTQRWLLISLLNGVFSRGCGWIPYKTGIRKILQVIKQFKGKLFPVQELFAVYRSHPLRFSEEIGSEVLDSWDRDFVLFLIYLGQDMAGRDIDHIHPRSKLEASYQSEEIHSVGNFQLLDSNTNRNEKRAKSLDEWLKVGVTDRKAYMKRHLVPEDPELHKVVAFRQFLTARIDLIVEKISDLIPSAPQETTVTVPPSPSPPKVENKLLDIDSLRNEIPESWRDHPILQNQHRWQEVYKEMGLGRRWSGSYRKEVERFGIVTVADMAIVIMSLRLEFWEDVGYAKTYRFHKPYAGATIQFKKSKLGGWGWKVTLDYLEQRGFDWREFLS